MIEIVSKTASTNSELAERLRGGAYLPEGQWLVADRQTGGKGRGGRQWLDGAGNFMGSTLVHLRPGDPPAPTLALLCGLAVHHAAGTFLPPATRPMLKWPNDVMIGTAKLGGVLLERQGDAVIVGIGVNLAFAPALADRETVALSTFGPAPARDAFAAQLARSFATDLDRWRGSGVAPMVVRWLAAGHPVGTTLSVGEPGEPVVSGTFAGLGEDGALQLRRADGRTHEVRAGEVRLATSGSN